MDSVTMIILENRLDIPLDVLIFMNEFIYEELNDNNFQDAVNLWFFNKGKCIFKYGHISTWKTQKITDMSNVSNVKDMRCTFLNAKNFNSDISQWNVNNVKNMNYMFCDAKKFNFSLDNWNMSNVKNTDFMFYGTNNKFTK